jgi:hypothetical protein
MHVRFAVINSSGAALYPLIQVLRAGAKSSAEAAAGGTGGGDVEHSATAAYLSAEVGDASVVQWLPATASAKDLLQELL